MRRAGIGGKDLLKCAISAVKGDMASYDDDEYEDDAYGEDPRYDDDGGGEEYEDEAPEPSSRSRTVTIAEDSEERGPSKPRLKRGITQKVVTSSSKGNALGSDGDKDDNIALLTEAQTHANSFVGYLENVDALADALSIVRIQEGETIMAQGETGTWVGILLRGTLDVIVGGKAVFTIMPGNFVGEMILWTGGVRQATVVAGGEGVIATILVSELNELAQSNPALASKLLQSTAAQSCRSVIRTKVMKEVNGETCLERCLKLTKVPAVRCTKQWDNFFRYVEKETGWKPPDVSAEGVAVRDVFTSRCEVRLVNQGDILMVRARATRTAARAPARTAAAARHADAVLRHAQAANNDSSNFIVMLLQGSLSVTKPTVGTFHAPEVVGEFGFLGEKALQEQLEVAAASSGMVGLLRVDSMHEILKAIPDYIVPPARAEPAAPCPRACCLLPSRR
jgi:hypothetical protein